MVSGFCKLVRGKDFPATKRTKNAKGTKGSDAGHDQLLIEKGFGTRPLPEAEEASAGTVVREQ